MVRFLQHTAVKCGCRWQQPGDNLCIFSNTWQDNEKETAITHQAEQN